MHSILIVDDEDGMRQLLDAALARAGYYVRQCADGADVTGALKEQSADLLITDLFMLQTDGLETIMKVRKEFPDLKIIAISGGTRLTDYDYLHVAAKLGANRTLHKPIEVNLLLKTVRELLIIDEEALDGPTREK